MGIVYRKEDSADNGFAVASEKEAIRYCKNHEGFDYVWRFIETIQEDQYD